MKLAIVDDHDIVREGIAALLETKITNANVTHSEAVESLLLNNYNESFDLILLDYFIPGSNAVDNFMAIKNNYQNAKIIFISSDESDDVSKHAFELGANGFVVKSANTDLLTAVIQLISNSNEVYFPNNIKTRTSLDKALSTSQFNCIALLLKNYKYQDISKELGITVGTVKQHISASYKRLGIKNKKELFQTFKK